MNLYGTGNVSDSCSSRKKAPKDEWTEIVDKVEAAILMSLANKVLAEAVDRQDQIDEHRRQLKLVELRNFSRRTYAG
jgi:hypothetical protein